MADIFDIVADATRRDILRVLLDASGGETPGSGDISVSEIVTTLELSQPTVSKHLKVLREAGFVTVRIAAQQRMYRIELGPLAQVDEWLAPYRRMWTEHLDALERHLDTME